MSDALRKFSPLFLLVLTFVTSPQSYAADTDPNVIWPLCGRISENPPPGWVDTDGCPSDRFGDASYSDEPLSSTFGPRPLASESNRYDFHRGVDIATPIGTPFFAIADGSVQIVGPHPSYSDPLVRLRHIRPGETDCSVKGCYNSFYLHIDSWVVAQDQQVVKGELLGYTGASGSGFEHVHFEVRDAPDFDVNSAWSRDAIHPLSVVPYSAPNNTSMVFNDVDFTNPSAGRVDLTLTSNRFDLVFVGLELFDSNQQPLIQSGSTANANGYHINPPFFDMELANFNYSHKDSTAFPWESFDSGGVNECPYHADHGTSYNANTHMDAQQPGEPLEGLFNGLHILTQKYWPSDVDDYEVRLEFEALENVASCVQATAVFASGDTANSEWGTCDAGTNQSPAAAMTWSCQGFDCAFDGSTSSDPDGTVTSYAWDFGDGQTGTGIAPNHTFPSAGSWSVMLTVTDNESASNNVIESVSVTESLLVRGPYLQMQTDDGISIHWRTDINTDSVVNYGTSPGNLNNTVTIAGSRMDHQIDLVGLGANQKYWYSVGDSFAPIAGDSSYHFSTAPTQGAAADTRIWVLGDSGTANADARAVRDAYKAWSSSNPADLWLMLGDNAYNDGTDAEYEAAVFDTYPEVLRQLPLWSTLGNHDGHNADSSTQTGPYYDIFNLPTNAEIGGLPSGTEAYYSFDYANIHFICLDSYDSNRAVNGTMMTWLQNDLALNTQPWVIAFWHHPPYTKGSHNSDTEGRLIDMRQNALPLLEDWGVDLVMSGHSHSYERSYLLDGHYDSSLTLDPVANVLNPGDGNENGDGVYQKPDAISASREGAVYAVAGSSGKITNAALDHPAMFVNLVSLGSLVVDVSGNRMDVVFLDQSGAVRDDFSIVKTPDIEPPLISSAATEDATHVLLSFNEEVDLLEAETLGNYTIAGLSINQVELQPNGRDVRLTTSTMTPDANYTLVVNNIEDLAGNVIATDSQISFDFFDIMSVTFQDGLKPAPDYNGTFDAYIREASATTAHGLETTLQVDGDEPSGSTSDMNILLGWDVSSIPIDATVESASIELRVTNSSPGAYLCHRLLAAWEQSEVTWNDASTGVPWTSPGASSPSDQDSVTVCTVTAASTGSLTINLGTDGLDMVQNWVQSPGGNHGLIISGPDVGDGADFHSSESSTVDARPALNVTYRVPMTPGNVSPVAGFTYSCTELDCSFTDTSTDSDGSVVAWDWDFGDGNTSTSQNPAHSYAADGNYTVSLTATDNDGDSNLSSQNVDVAITPDTEAPTVPVSLQVDSVTSNSISLSWNASTDNVGVSGYEIFRDGGLVTSTTDTQHTDAGLTPGTDYDYQVRAYDAAGNRSALSGPVTGSTDSNPVDVLTLIEARYLANRDEFRVKASSSEQPNVTLEVVGFGPMTFKRDKYEYKLKPVGNISIPPTVDIISSLGAVLTATVDGAPPPAVPGQASAPSPGNGAIDIAVNTSLDWSAGSNTDSHDVYFGTSSTPPLVGNQAGTGFNPGTLANNTTYYWRIDENNSFGTTVGNVWSFTTVGVPMPPGQATNPSPSDGAVNADVNVNLSWNAGSQTDTHNVYFGTTSNPPLVSAGQSATSFDPGALNELTTYYWRVDEVNPQGTSTGQVWSFTTADAVTEDSIEIIKAEWKNSRDELKVEATSTAAPNAVLTVVGFGQMTYDANKNKYKFSVRPVNNPGSVTVTSDLGGSAIQTVIIR